VAGFKSESVVGFIPGSASRSVGRLADTCARAGDHDHAPVRQAARAGM